MIYILCKTMINNGNYEKADMTKKLDVFLLGNRITTEQYTELIDLMEENN